MSTRVSIVRDKDLRRKTVNAISLIGGIGRFVHKNDKVMIKPNLVDGAPHETGETVHPDVVRTIIQLAYEAGASRVTIGEGPTWQDLTLHYTYEEMAKEENAEMLDFNLLPFDEVKVKSPTYFEKVRLAHALFDCDVFINVPTLKTHHLAGLTVALKNLYGGLPLEDKGMYHRLDRVEEAIVDMNMARLSDLIVVDGTYSTHHIPPFETHELDLAIAGTDPVAVDAVAAKVIGVNPKTLRYLTWAAERGLGVNDLNYIDVVGLSIEEAYERSTVTSVDRVNRMYNKIKIINCGACTGCYGRIATALFRRRREEDLKKDLYVVMGPESTQPVSEGDVILCGTCAAPTFYNKLKGTFVHGCPPDIQEFRKTLDSFGARRVREPQLR